MARLILKSPYLKPGGKKSPGCYLKYIATREGVEMAEDTSRHLPATAEQQKQITRLLKKYPDNTVRVAGYTDSLGDPNYNVDLSQRRAKAVAMELVKEGVPAKNVSFIGYGAANPVATNKTSKGRAQNRRVELEITNN